MSETQREQATYASESSDAPEATAWVGWILFAGTMLLLVGSFQMIAGFVALFDHHYYLVRSANLTVHLSYTGWGWIHLALGALAIAAGYGIMVGKMWARVYAIFLAGVSAIVNLGFLNAYPIWSVMMITIDVLVIWALTVHGREVKSTDY